MAKERHIDKLMSVFSLTVGEDLDFPENVSTQVVFVYNREANVKELKTLQQAAMKRASVKGKNPFQGSGF